MADQFDVAVHGRKRPAEGELDDQPLAKKFGRLQIGTLAINRFPVSREGQAQCVPKRYGSNDTMMLDDTDTTVYIHDLEQELAESDAFDPAITILPGLEDRLSMTKMLVAETKHPCTDIVLYREPESLTVPKDKDQVRWALMETRERARLGQERVRSGIHQRSDSRCIDQAGRTGSEKCRQNDNSADKMDIDAD
ncbi:hypothetical protein BJX76DRAFT_351297 [Aspergillus varians]